MTDQPTDPHANDAQPYSGGDPYADYRGADADFTTMVDLSDRRLGASVIAANDEFFAERENLLDPHTPVFDPTAFGHKGKVMDGWETRRRRGPSAAEPHSNRTDHDWALVRLGLPGIVRGILVDTAHFRGNYPQQISVEAAHVEGTPSPEELLNDETIWEEIVGRTPVQGHAANTFTVTTERRWTHLRLKQYPDGGIARLRVYGDVVCDPEWLALLDTFDLAALENGGATELASDSFFSPTNNMILPGRSRKMDDGWETRRRRDTGNDWVRLRLTDHSQPRAIEIDTGYLKGNAAGWVAVSTCDATTADPEDPSSWTEIIGRTPLQPDATHRFRVDNAPAATHARVDIFPDGGMARLRFHGSLTDTGERNVRARWNQLRA